MQHTTTSHLLLLGAPRSGTTLLAAMLGCHPDIALLNEDTHGASLSILSKRIRGVKLCIPNQIELEHHRVMRLSDAAARQLQRRTNKIRKLLGFKTPIVRSRKSDLSIRDYEKRTDTLHILATVRSPHQVIRSIMSRGEQSQRTAEYRWRRAIEILDVLSTEHSDHTNLMLVDFDRLVTDPSTTLRCVLDGLSCEFHPNVLEGFKHTPQYAGRTAISAAKASTGISDALNHPLLRTDTELRQRYLRVMRMCI